MADIQKLQDITSQVRRDIVRMVNAVSSGHPGGSLGCAELIVTLYNEVMITMKKSSTRMELMKTCFSSLKGIFHQYGIVF